jgi:hypothetical protein
MLISVESTVGASEVSPAREGWENKNGAMRIPFALLYSRKASILLFAS